MKLTQVLKSYLKVYKDTYGESPGLVRLCDTHQRQLFDEVVSSCFIRATVTKSRLATFMGKQVVADSSNDHETCYICITLANLTLEKLASTDSET